MKENILSEDAWTWVEQRKGSGGAEHALQARKMLTADEVEKALVQLDARRKASSKLRALLEEHPRFYFPSALLAEQCTAPAVADFNAEVSGATEGMLVADLTFGLGMDAFALARKGSSVTGIDINAGAAEAGQYNAALLGADVEVICDDALHWLAKEGKAGRHYDLLFIDPARRDAAGGRVYSLDDCVPDLQKVLPLASRLTDTVIVKASPMLDVDAVMKRWIGVDRIWCVGLKGECKELLLRYNFKPASEKRKVVSVELDGHGGSITLEREWPGTRRQRSGEVEVEEGMWLCIPSAAIVKGRPTEAIMERWPGLTPLGTTCYLSGAPLQGWPGRCLRIERIYHSLRRAMKDLRGEAANTAVSNYPATAEALRAKIGLRPLADGSRFLVGCTVGTRKLLLWCTVGE